jgi:hypothetical protein
MINSEMKKPLTSTFRIMHNQLKFVFISFLILVPLRQLPAQENIDVGKTGWDVKRLGYMKNP